MRFFGPVLRSALLRGRAGLASRLSLIQWVQGSSPWGCTQKARSDGKSDRAFLVPFPYLFRTLPPESVKTGVFEAVERLHLGLRRQPRLLIEDVIQ